MSHWRRKYFLLLMLLVIIASSDALFGKKKQAKAQVPAGEMQPNSSGLVEIAGHYLFRAVRKYKYYFMFITGYKLEEESTVKALCATCNVLYCALILAGLLTAAIGPVLVLIFFGIIGAFLVLAALYPFYTVCAMWLYFFFHSQLMQAVGVKLGLDVDNDGDVDLLDFLAYLARTRLGKCIGLHSIHEYLNSPSSLLEQIDRRLKQLEAKMIARLDNTPKSSEEELKINGNKH